VTTLSARHAVVVATGSGALLPEIAGLREAKPWTSREAASAKAVPTIAIVGEVPIARLWHAVPAYPTVSEVWLRLLETYGR
jgi:pyruvate/2-oxoglutarate dehydrogenase complex dihydrolipoamide dehydrogenase (E3) component